MASETIDNFAMSKLFSTRQCVGIGDEGKISSVFLPSGNGAHTPGRIEQILPFCFPGDRTPSESKGRYLAAWKEMADFTNPGANPPPINPVLTMRDNEYLFELSAGSSLEGKRRSFSDNYKEHAE